MEHLYIQQKFLSFVASQLDRFKQKGNLLWNFRCPYCGDSEKSEAKARGYIYKDKTGLLSFQCHNCGENHKFKTFLKFLNPRLYKEYVLESFKGEREESKVEEKKQEPEEFKDWTKFLTPISELSKIHPAVEYLKSRKIPKEKYKKFWYTSNFRDFVEKIGLEQTVPADPRIILTEIDKFGNLKILIARTFKSSELRYITLKIDESYPKIFGLSDLDYTKPVYVVEGAIDSLFLDNCIATLDANLLAYQKYNLGIKNAIHIWDNEPRNVNICRYMANAIRQNERVVIFPNDIHQKDINKMVEDGIDVNALIKKRTFHHVRAMMEYAKWKRINSNVNRQTLVSASHKKRTWVR